MTPERIAIDGQASSKYPAVTRRPCNRTVFRSPLAEGMRHLSGNAAIDESRRATRLQSQRATARGQLVGV